MDTAEDKKKALYIRQVDLLDTFLRKHAITPAQYRKSFEDLTRLMGMEETARELKGEARDGTA